jgi:hypothetical protein
MTAQQILVLLEELGMESYRKVLRKHDIPEPLYGVKIEELKKIAKKVQNAHNVAIEIYDSGIYDARYLAGILVDPALITEEQLIHWAKTANAPVLLESTVASVAAESSHGFNMAREWINSGDDALISCGWATLSDWVSLHSDSGLDLVALEHLLERVVRDIKNTDGRVKYTMNGFVISMAVYVAPLKQKAKEVAKAIGKLTIDMGNTSCKVPVATDYIEKLEKRNPNATKKKSVRC